jgi:folate-binding protein YgfZ
VRVVRLEDLRTGKNACPTFLIDTEAATHDRVLKTIERFTLAGDFHVTDSTGHSALLSLQGKRAADIVRLALGDLVAQTPRNGVTTTEWREQTVTVLRATHTSEDGFDLVVNAEHARALWEALVAAGARPFGHDALNILRIEAGRPRYGIDMDETTVVTEANLDDAVSYTKGCYVGQEIIARIKYRGHVAKKLVGVIFGRAVNLENEVKIRSLDDKEIGRITSATFSPHLGCTIALGYVKYDYLAPDTEVRAISGENQIAGKVSGLPIVRNGSVGAECL